MVAGAPKAPSDQLSRLAMPPLGDIAVSEGAAASWMMNDLIRKAAAPLFIIFI